MKDTMMKKKRMNLALAAAAMCALTTGCTTRSQLAEMAKGDVDAYMSENDSELKGEKGDKGDKGDKGKDGSVTFVIVKESEIWTFFGTPQEHPNLSGSYNEIMYPYEKVLAYKYHDSRLEFLNSTMAYIKCSTSSCKKIAIPVFYVSYIEIEKSQVLMNDRYAMDWSKTIKYESGNRCGSSATESHTCTWDFVFEQESSFYSSKSSISSAHISKEERNDGRLFYSEDYLAHHPYNEIWNGTMRSRVTGTNPLLQETSERPTNQPMMIDDEVSDDDDGGSATPESSEGGTKGYFEGYWI